MFSDVITYEDFNGNECSQEVFFNISKIEALELEASHPEGYGQYLTNLVDLNDNMLIFNAFKDIVKMAYGAKSEDGKKFIKSEEVYEDFKESPVYDEFMMKLLGDSDYALNFILGTMPATEGVTKESILNEMNKNNQLGSGN